MKEEMETVIEYDHIEPASMETILTFLYTGEISLTEDTAEDIVAIADYLIIPSIKEIGTLFLQKQITSRNCFALYVFGKKYGCKDLEAQTNDYINSNFEMVCFTDSFKNLDVKILLEMFQRDDIIVSKEELIFEAIQEWVYHDLDTRKQHFEKLFSCVRLSSTSKYYLADYVERENLVKESKLCSDLLFRAFKSLALPDRTISTAAGPMEGSKARDCLAKDEVGIIVTGGTYLTNQAYHTECFVPARGSWLKLADMHHPRDDHVTVMCENFLYSIGGYKKTNTVERYDPRINMWTDVAPLPVKCAAAAAVAVDGLVYVIGGRESFRPYNTVQCYNPGNNTWTIKASMIQHRKALSAVVLDGYIYAIGGINEKGLPLSGVESYDPGLDHWRHETTMNARRTLACATVLNRKIYVVGGYESESMTPLASCEVFDPDKGKWSILPDLLMRRAAAGISSLNGKIYILGGISENGARADIECYDAEKKKWEVVASMPAARAYIQCNVVKIPKEIASNGQTLTAMLSNTYPLAILSIHRIYLVLSSTYPLAILFGRIFLVLSNTYSLAILVTGSTL
ncbi:hypothetical protein QZH41_002042 [Actinostola sp. cb2023]|nr:hypothetical protein QZH41_002042 [Actinostola sp. cb2023]